MALLLSAAQMRAVDRAAMDGLGLPGMVLMENAGRGVAALVRAERPDIVGLDVRIVCGAGQNGGDGFVVARHLAAHGALVTVLLAAPDAKRGGDAALFAAVARRLPAIRVHDAAAETDPAVWCGLLLGAAVIVDALFGTGLRTDLSGTGAAAVAAMNQTPALRVAIDLPSGLDADSGVVRGNCVRAHVTATLGARKLGLVLDADAPVGRVVVVDLGVSIEALIAGANAPGPLCHWTEARDVRPALPRRRRSGHKGSAGHVLIVAGSPGKTGSALLAAQGAHRSGAGLVTIAATRAVQTALDAKVVEAMTACYGNGEDADEGSWGRIQEMAGRMRAGAVGPGLPTGPGTRALVARMIAELPIPLVVDAEALNLLGTELGQCARRASAPRILTPHPGEMARLLAIDTEAVQRDRLGAARALALASAAVVVLKGARTVVAEPDGTAHVNPAADPALGTAGSGDVLTGVIAGLCAQGLSALEAARAGVFLHGEAADLAAELLGSRNLVAGDLPDAVARALERERRACEGDPDRASG